MPSAEVVWSAVGALASAAAAIAAWRAAHQSRELIKDQRKATHAERLMLVHRAAEAMHEELFYRSGSMLPTTRAQAALRAALASVKEDLPRTSGVATESLPRDLMPSVPKRELGERIEVALEEVRAAIQLAR